MSVGDVVVTGPDERGVRSRWTHVPPSPVSERAFQDSDPPEPGTTCMICKAPAVGKAMFMFQVDSTKEEDNEVIRGVYQWQTRDADGEIISTPENDAITKSERIAVMYVCREHRGQWILEEIRQGYLWAQNWEQN